MKDKLGDKVRIQHILDAIGEIEHYSTEATFEQFTKNSMMKFASIKEILL